MSSKNQEMKTEPKTEKDWEVKRTRRVFWIMEGISLAMAVVGILLPFTNVPFLDYVGILVAIIGVMWMIMNPVHYAKERKRIADIYCPVCGTKYDWDKDVGCEVTDSEANARITVTGDVKSSAHDTVEFECHCHNCGNVTTFSKRFKTGKGKNGHIQSQSLERLARKYFD